MAIQATNAGVDFQQRISAFMMILMEFEIDIDMVLNIGLKDKIEQLNFEASDKVDDLVITTFSGRKVYMQMKRNISFSEEKDSEFYGVCAQFIKQYCENDINDVAYILVTRSQASNKITIKLKRILEGIRLANSIEIKKDLTRDEVETLEKFENNIKSEYEKITGKQINDESLKKLLCKIYVEVFDIESGESFEKNVKLILYNKLNIDVNLFWNMLISLAVQYGGNRRCLDKTYLHKTVKNYINLFEYFEDKGELLKTIWNLENESIEVQKDYVAALPRGELKKDLDNKEGEKKRIFLMEIYRLKNGEKKCYPKYEAPNIMRSASDLEFEILFRCSSRTRLENYINRELEKVADKDTEVVLMPVKGEFEEEAVEIAHRELLKKSIESKSDCKCINCGMAILEEEAYVIELDNVECSHKAGIIHKECLRPIDRVLGVAKIPNIKKYSYLKNFDINLWIKLLLNGKQAWGNIEGFSDNIFNMTINTDEVFHDGKYCIKISLNSGEIRYVTNRGKIERLSKREAEDLVCKFNQQYEEARKNNNPICYSKETYVYAPYEQLLVQMGGKEEIVECESAEVALYNETIAKLYNECETYYTPIIYLTLEGEPLILDGIFPLITNPLDLAVYLNNWKAAGITINNYEVNIIEDDNDFILKMISLISNGIRPIVNMLLGRNKKLLKGCIINLMIELEAMHEMSGQVEDGTSEGKYCKDE